MKLTHWHIIALFICLTQGSAISADTLHIDESFTRIELSQYSRLYVDTTGEQKIEYILANPLKFIDQFEVGQESRYPEAYWLHIPIFAEHDIVDARLLMPGDSLSDYIIHIIDKMDMYMVDKSGMVIAHETSGYEVPKSHKSIQGQKLLAVVPLTLRAGEQSDMYIRIQNLRVPQSINLGLELQPNNAALPIIDLRQVWIILCPLGMFIIIGLFVFIFYFYVRETSYLYFGIFCFFYAIDLLFLRYTVGLLNLFPEHPSIGSSLWYTTFLGLPFLLLFGNSFINVKGNFPKWYKYYRLYFIYFTGVVIWYFIRNWWWPIMTTQPVLVLSLLLLIPICVRFVISDNWSARLFAAGIFSFLAGNAIGAVAEWYGHHWGPYSWALGQMILLLLFAAGLGYRLLESQQQKAEGEKIKELDLLKSRFFTNISHEFRTPLSLILGPLQNAEESIPLSESEIDTNEMQIKAGSIRVMKRNALRLQQLIDQILDLSKLESGKMKLQLQESAVVKFIRSRIAEFESIASNKNIHLIAAYPEEICDAVFDADMLEKIVVNILSNAIKFTPANGEVKVKVDSEGDYVKVKISDSGPGLTKHESDHIFDRFYQADDAANQGSGIGMALVKELVGFHKGSISVQSQQNIGTTISFSICINRDRFARNELKPDTHLIEEKIRPALTPTNDPISTFENHVQEANRLDNVVLVVEDNEDLRLFIKEILENDHHVLLASNGIEGKELALEHLPDLIISDIMMPKMSGTEMCDYLKKEEKTCHIPIVLLSAKAERDDKLKGLTTGADDYLTKPFDSKELKVKTENLIKIREKLRDKYSSQPWKIALQKVSSLDEKFLQNVATAIQKNLSNEYYSVEELGKEIAYSRSQLFRKLKVLTSKSPLDLIREYRLNYAKELLEKKATSVSEAAYQVGYSNLSYFTKSFKNEFGVMPSEVLSL